MRLLLGTIRNEDLLLVIHRSRRMSVFVLVSLALSLLTSSAAFSQDRDILILGTATPGGGFPVYGEALAEALNQVDPSLEVRTRNTKGSTENVPLLREGKLDIALVQGEVVHEVFSAVNQPPANLKIVAAMYSTAGVFVVRGDSDYRSIRDLMGHPVVFGTRGSGLTILARYVLDGMGLDIDRDFKSIYVDRAGDGPVMVEEGFAAAMWGGGIGWPGFVTVAKAKNGARFIAPDADEVNRILAKQPFLRRMTIPAGSYPGQDSPVDSVGSWSFVIARATLPNDIAYRLARALHSAEALIGRRLPQARETTMANTAAVAPRLDSIHPGVLRYLREIGLIQ